MGVSMKLSNYCRTELIELHLESENKKDVLAEIVDVGTHSGRIHNKKEVLAAIMDREKLGSTGVGFGVAFPHARTGGVSSLTIIFGRSINGVSFGAIDRKLVHLFFMVLTPMNSEHMHLQILAKLSLIMHNEQNREIALTAEFPQQILDLIDS